MPLRKVLSLLVLVISLSGLTKCATPPNVPLCVPLGSARWKEFIAQFEKTCDLDNKCVMKKAYWLTYLQGLSPSDRGWCTMTISDDEFFVDGLDHLFKNKDGVSQTWSEMEKSSIRMPPESTAAIKAFILKSCRQSRRCPKDLTTWTRKTSELEQRAWNPNYQIP